MKRSRLNGALLLAISGTYLIYAVDSTNPLTPSNFGKTHFIVGLPRNQAAAVVPKAPEAVYSDATVNTPCWLCSNKTAICQAFFSPQDDIKAILIDLIAHEQKSIRVTIFMFTEKEIAQALIAAHQRGVLVEVITDGGNAKDRYSKIPLLQKEGIAVYIYQPQDANSMLSDIMHHKFVVFEKNNSDKSLVWTGSFNFTKSANARNQENVVVLDDVAIIKQFRDRFEQLKRAVGKPKKHKETIVAHHNKMGKKEVTKIVDNKIKNRAKQGTNNKRFA